MPRMLGFGVEHDANFGARKSFANAGEDRWRGGARRAESGGGHADRGVQDTSDERHRRGLRSRDSSFWREPHSGVGREARGHGRIGGHVASDWTFTEQ